MAQLSDDCFAHGGRLMTVAEAFALLEDKTQRVTETETRALSRAFGCILAADVTSAIDVPAHDNSAVDGYAVYFDDLDATSGETRLAVTGRATAGHPLDRVAQRGEAIRIFTGALMPEGPDTVLMQEDCRLEGDDVVIPSGIKRGANRRQRGEDVEVGQVVLRQGQVLRAQDLGQAASIGIEALPVSVPLRVALFSTGDELREPGAELEAGTIYDSNRFTVAALLRALGCHVNDLGILPDRLDSVRSAIADAAQGHDLLITSGGVSVGEEDHVKAAVEALGHMHLWRLAIKPGRPIAFGQVGHIPFVGLPGNPVAVMVTFLNLVRPLILRLMGGTALQPHHFQVTAAFDYKKKKDRREWVRVRLEAEGPGLWRAVKFPRDGAGILSSLVEADGLVELPEDLTSLESGSLVNFLPFSEVT